MRSGQHNTPPSTSRRRALTGFVLFPFALSQTDPPRWLDQRLSFADDSDVANPIAPETTLLFETELPDGLDPRDIEWVVDEEDEVGVFMMGYQDHVEAAAMSTTFDEPGTYEITAYEPDSAELESWTITCEEDGRSGPEIETAESDPGPNHSVHADEPIEKHVSVVDSEQNLDRVYWQEAQNQVDITEEADVSGGTATDSVTFSGPEGDDPGGWMDAGYGTRVCAVTSDGRVSDVESIDGPEIRPPFTISIDEALVTDTGEVEVTATVENEVGVMGYPAEDQQEIALDLDEEPVESDLVSLRFSESTSITLSSSSPVEGPTEVTVRTPVDSDSTTISPNERDDPDDTELEVAIVDTNTPVYAGEFLEVTADLENTGTTETTAMVEFVVGDDPEIADSEPVSLAADESTTLSLGYETPIVTADQSFPVRVVTDTAEAEQTVTVYGTD